MKIKERGCIRHVSKRAFENKWKALGYEIVEEEELEDLTYKELYEKAQDLDITGRGSMDKEELLVAIKKVE